MVEWSGEAMAARFRPAEADGLDFCLDRVPPRRAGLARHGSREAPAHVGGGAWFLPAPDSGSSWSLVKHTKRIIFFLFSTVTKSPSLLHPLSLSLLLLK